MAPHPDALWAEYQSLFDHLTDVLWLNHAGVSPVSGPVADSMKRHVDEVARQGALGVPDWYASLRDIRGKAADLLGGRAADVAVTPNTTHGINLIANGLAWAEGDEVLLASQEYPANVYPWWAQTAYGVKLVWVEPDEEGRLPVSAYAAKLTERTRVITVSHVQFASGYRSDLPALAALAREVGALLVVDAIQSFGVFEIDVEGWGVDALTTGAHKWLLGPTGAALFYTTSDLREQIQPGWVGADCMVDSLDYLNYKFEPLPDARRFENAMFNFTGVAGLRAALDVVHRFGRPRIETEIRAATDRIAAFLEDLGFTLHSPRRQGEWSGILSLSHPRATPEQICAGLKQRNVIASVRDGKLRVSPHAYYTDRCFETIEQAFDESLSAAS